MELRDVEDQIDEIIETTERSERIDVMRARLAEFSPGEVGRASYLAALAGELDMVKDHEGAREASLAAIEDGGPLDIDPRCGLLMTELHAGDDARADEVLAELLAKAKTGLLNPVECEWIADSLAEAGRYRQALRWHNIPLRDLDPGELEEHDLSNLNARHDVRRRLGLPLDAFDEARELLLRVLGDQD